MKSDANEKLLTEKNQKISEYEKRIKSLAGENRTLRNNNMELSDLRNGKDMLK